MEGERQMEQKRKLLANAFEKILSNSSLHFPCGPLAGVGAYLSSNDGERIVVGCRKCDQ